MLSVNPVTTFFIMIAEKEKWRVRRKEENTMNFFTEIIILQCFVAHKKRVKSYQNLEAVLLSGRKRLPR